MSNISILFFSVILEGFPYILLGALISAAIEVFIPTETIKRYAGKNNLTTIFYFGLLGFILPVCECGIAPVAARLRKKGVQTGPMLAYLLSAPAFQPIVMFSTYSAFNNNLKIASLRCAVSLFIAVTIAFILRNIQPLKIQIEPENQIPDKIQHNTNAISYCSSSPSSADFKTTNDNHNHNHNHNYKHNHSSCCPENHNSNFNHHSHFINSETCRCEEIIIANHSNSQSSKSVVLISIFIKELALITAYLTIGALVASIISYYNPVDIYGSSSKNILGIIIMMCMAVILSVCSEADAFVAYSFSGFGIAAKLAFM